MSAIAICIIDFLSVDFLRKLRVFWGFDGMQFLHADLAEVVHPLCTRNTATSTNLSILNMI